MHVVVLTKRQYTNKDVIDDRYGRLWELPLGLARRDCRVTCFCLSYRNRDVEHLEYTSPEGHTVRWISVNLGRLVLPGLLRYFLATRKFIRAERPDVVWSCSDIIYTILGRFFSRRYGCLSIADLYDNFEYFAFYKLPFLGRLFRRAVREAAGASVVSEALRKHIVDDYGRSGDTAVISNAVDQAAFRPLDKAACREQLGLPRNALIIGSAGDISNYRGADMMYRLHGSDNTLSDTVHLAVAGYRNAATEIPVGETVHDLGTLSPDLVPVFLNALDVAVVYNRASTFGDYCFPQKFYEMLACGTPIVAADVGELRLLLREYRHLLYEDQNLQSFVNVVKRQLERREIPAIPVPSWQEQADRLLQHIESVAGQRPSPETQAFSQR